MNFGAVEYSKLEGVNFKLPKEPSTNNRVLKDKPSPNTRFHVGLSSWGRKEWIGKIYPIGIKEKDFISAYAKQYNAIELNATHYKLYSPADLQKWVDKLGKTEFIFSPKLYQGISHFGTLNDKAFLTETFLNSMRSLGSHLGPVFIQVSDKFSPKRKDELFTYLEALPGDVQFFLELRQEDWFKGKNIDELFSKMADLKIGGIINDAAGRRDVVHMHLSVPKIMIRFIGNDLHSTDFKRLDDWVARIKYWVENGIEEVYFFVHCLNEAFAPELSRYLVKKLNEQCNAGLNEIRFIDQAK